MYQKLQALLPEFLIEPVTIDNLSTYEIVFYSNEEYYRLTDGHPATREQLPPAAADPPSPCRIGSAAVAVAAVGRLPPGMAPPRPAGKPAADRRRFPAARALRRSGTDTCRLRRGCSGYTWPSSSFCCAIRPDWANRLPRLESCATWMARWSRSRRPGRR